MQRRLKSTTKYILPMFPYPSGHLHMGHFRIYTLSDVIARYNRLLGHLVIHPIGWDSFGLPAENAARDRNTSAIDWTRENIKEMKRSLKRMNISFDWDREISTADESYYKWTQWIFLKMFGRGLVERRDATVNWDPVDLTVLANEQVSMNGRAERSGALVERRRMFQYFLKSTNYAQVLFPNFKSLYDTLELLDWPDHVKTQQRNWIKPQRGLGVTGVYECNGIRKEIRCFIPSTKPFNMANFVVIGPEHPLLSDIPLSQKAIHDFCNSSMNSRNRKNDMSKGFFTGIYFEHAILGKLPIWVAAFLAQDPSACNLGVPFNFHRHHLFALKNAIPIPEPSKLNLHDAIEETQFKMRDWLISRQRKWGTPIPLINCKSCGVLIS